MPLENFMLSFFHLVSLNSCIHKLCQEFIEFSIVSLVSQLLRPTGSSTAEPFSGGGINIVLHLSVCVVRQRESNIKSYLGGAMIVHYQLIYVILCISVLSSLV